MSVRSSIMRFVLTHPTPHRPSAASAPPTPISPRDDIIIDGFEQQFDGRSHRRTLQCQAHPRFCHLAIWQEKELCRKTRVITAYCCHPFAVLRGGTIKGVVGELLGRQVGMSHSKGGSLHIFTPSFFGELGQVFEGLQHGAPAFLLFSYGRTNGRGQAKLWNHPCLFVCENNKDKILGLQVNRMEMNAVPGSPVCVQVDFVTYRYGGHSMSDPCATYRTRERYIEWSLASEQELKQLDKDDKDITAEADAPLLKFAMLRDAR
ncbi:hypothetical protein B0H11DRAFT_2229596 [Mycena galericulata]|nr:hypothetical protein B0H11DRAFT_2229596 [Mycena galericulata]